MFSVSLFLSPGSLRLWLGFFLSSQTRQTSDPTRDWPGFLQSPRQLASQTERLSLSFSLYVSHSQSFSLALLAVLQARVVWHDNFSEQEC